MAACIAAYRWRRWITELCTLLDGREVYIFDLLRLKRHHTCEKNRQYY
jgi:hypothetical protein